MCCCETIHGFSAVRRRRRILRLLCRLKCFAEPSMVLLRNSATSGHPDRPLLPRFCAQAKRRSCACCAAAVGYRRLLCVRSLSKTRIHARFGLLTIRPGQNGAAHRSTSASMQSLWRKDQAGRDFAEFLSASGITRTPFLTERTGSSNRKKFGSPEPPSFNLRCGL